jgi:peptidoglycan biosynthesis protein MviN/MurJ (putative lipid II flippase)
VNDLSLAWGLTIGGIAALCVTLAVAFRIQFLSGRRRTTTGLTKPR